MKTVLLVLLMVGVFGAAAGAAVWTLRASEPPADERGASPSKASAPGSVAPTKDESMSSAKAGVRRSAAPRMT